MAQAKQNDAVKVHYKGTLNDGSVFDTSFEREPLEFTIGEGRIIPGFEQAVLGMAPGDSKTVIIPPEEAYGPYDEGNKLVVGRDQFPPDIEPELGKPLQVQVQGQTALVRITEIAGDQITLDANHPLAGQELTFEIQLVDIV
jgi:peptidylprolyl isomerase